MTAHPEKPTVAEIQRLVDLYYAIDGNGTGGSLHIVLDDYNVETGYVEFCEEWAIQRGDARGHRLAGLLLHMSTTQRRVIAMSKARSFLARDAAGAEFDELAAPLIERWLT